MNHSLYDWVDLIEEKNPVNLLETEPTFPISFIIADMTLGAMDISI